MGALGIILIVLATAAIVVLIVVISRKNKKVVIVEPPAKEPPAEIKPVQISYDPNVTIGFEDDYPCPTLCLEDIGTDDAVPYTSPMKDVITVGRKEGLNDIVIPDGAVSSNHCTFKLKNNFLYVYDNDSSNGTFIRRGDKMARLPAPADVSRAQGDILRIGNRDYKVSIEK